MCNLEGVLFCKSLKSLNYQSETSKELTKNPYGQSASCIIVYPTFRSIQYKAIIWAILITIGTLNLSLHCYNELKIEN